MEQKLERIDSPADPDRCQAVGATGQCPYKVVEGQKFCQRHGGTSSTTQKEKNSANQYRLQVWQERLEHFSGHDRLTSIRDEICILRFLMEELLNQSGTANKLYLNSGRIADLATKIEKLVTSCNRAEQKMGMLLDKGAALNLAGSIVHIISKHVTDADVIDAISNDIIDVLAKINGNS